MRVREGLHDGLSTLATVSNRRPAGKRLLRSVASSRQKVQIWERECSSDLRNAIRDALPLIFPNGYADYFSAAGYEPEGSKSYSKSRA
jgi:hypothetical protein